MGKHIHRWIAAIAVVVVAIGFVGWKVLGGVESRPAGRPASAVQNPQLTQLLPYSGPSPDTVVVSSMGDSNVVLRQDPFGRPSAAVAEQERPATMVAPRSLDVDGPHWHVTATLMHGARRAAVINDALVYVGDSVPGGGKLTAVERDRVTLTDTKGASHTVTVKEGDG